MRSEEGSRPFLINLTRSVSPISLHHSTFCSLARRPRHLTARRLCGRRHSRGSKAMPRGTRRNGRSAEAGLCAAEPSRSDSKGVVPAVRGHERPLDHFTGSPRPRRIRPVRISRLLSAPHEFPRVVRLVSQKQTDGSFSVLLRHPLLADYCHRAATICRALDY